MKTHIPAKVRMCLVALCALSCTRNDYIGNDVQVISPIISTAEISDLEQYITELSIEPLWNDSLCISGVSKLIPVDSSVVILSGSVLYSCMLPVNGESDITRIGNVGRGPGEYLMLKDFAISLDGDEILCLDISGNILRYAIDSGDYVGMINTGIRAGCAEAILPLQNARVAVYIPNPVISEITKEDIEFYSLHIFDYDGKEVSRELKWSDLNIEASFSNPVSVSAGGCYILSPESSCPSLIYKDGEFSKSLFFDFQRKNLPYRYAFRNGDNPWNSIGDIFASDYYKLSSSVFMLSDAIYFKAFGKQSSLWNFLIPSSGKKGIRWMSRPMVSPPIYAIGTDVNCLYFSYDDCGLVENEEDPLKKAVLNRFGKLESANGSYLIKVKLSFDEE